MILWRSEASPAKASFLRIMLFLALTGGFGFLGTASVAYLDQQWGLAWTAMLLAATSALWHGTQRPVFWYADQVAMGVFVGTALYDAACRGPIPLAMGLANSAYSLVTYTLGKRWKCWAWHPDEWVYYHATLHILPPINLLSAVTFFPLNNETLPDLLLLSEGDCGPSTGPRLLEG